MNSSFHAEGQVFVSRSWSPWAPGRTYDGELLTGETLSGVVAGSMSWTYDDHLRVDTEMVQGNTVDYVYDAEGRLTGVEAMSKAAAAMRANLLLVLLCVVGCPHPPAGFYLSGHKPDGSAERCLVESNLDVERDELDRSSFIRCTPTAPVDGRGARGPLLIRGLKCDVWFTEEPEGEANAFRLRALCPTETPSKDETERASAFAAYTLISSRCPGFPPVDGLTSEDI